MSSFKNLTGNRSCTARNRPVQQGSCSCKRYGGFTIARQAARAGRRSTAGLNCLVSGQCFGNGPASDLFRYGLCSGGLSPEGCSPLALQLHFLFKPCTPDVRLSCFCLMSASPKRPCDDAGGLDALLGEFDGNASDFLDRPADQERLVVTGLGIVFLGGAALA